MSVADRILKLLFPPKCAVCGEILDYYKPRSEALCDRCLREWENEELESCGDCGKKIGDCECLTKEMQDAKCGAFCKLVYYRGRSRRAVQNRLLYHLKDTPDRAASLFCAERLLPALNRLRERDGAAVDECVITHIPRGRRARLQAGTDQAKALACALSSLSEVPYERLILRHPRANTQQKTLSTRARLENVRSAFRVSPKASLVGRTVFLVDDIVTTGASMSACARILRRAGARAVYCLAVAADDATRGA